MATKSIAFFMHDFSGGGVEAMRANLATEMRSLDYEVSIVVARSDGPVAASVAAKITVVDLHSTGFVQTTIRLRRYILAAKPDFLISSLDHNNIMALLSLIGRRVRTRFVICQHNALSQEVKLGWRYRIVPFLYWILQNRASAIVAVSAGVADDLAATANLSRSRVHVISNPVITTDFLAQTAGAAPHPWLTQSRIPVFIFAGRLVDQKDPTTLIRAFAQYLKIKPGKLIILGEGDLREGLSKLVHEEGMQKHVHFAGYVNDTPRWIVHASALVLTSKYEGFGNVIVESLACGTPVIATDCRHGPREILADGRYGRLVNVSDPDAVCLNMLDDLRQLFPVEKLRARGLEFTASRAALAHDSLLRHIHKSPARTVFGLRFTAATADDITTRIVSEPARKANLIVTPNIDHVRLLRLHDFRAACIDSELICADGWPVALFARLRSRLPIRRVTGCDVLHSLLTSHSLGSRKIVAVLESTETAAALRKWTENQGTAAHWKARVAPPRLSGNPAGQADLMESIIIDQPDILLMTLGAPVSEIMAHRFIKRLPPCWVLCVGQALRVELGLIARAPASWQRIGLEWAWRLLHEPRRLGVRYLLDIAWFPCAIGLELARVGRPKQPVSLP